MSKLPNQINDENKYQLFTDMVENMTRQEIKASLRVMKLFLTEDK